MTSEFVNAYSDDQIYMEMIENLINNHPTEANVPETIKYSSFSRLWIVMMIGSIEMMIKQWAVPEPMMSDIASYFKDGSNEERINRLYSALRLRGLEVDRDCFDDFLACKYIRNAYVHGAWNENQRSFVASRNLPSSSMEFKKEDYDRVKKCYYHLLNSLGMANALNTVLKSKYAASDT